MSPEGGQGRRSGPGGVWSVVVAAGSGQRFGAAKQFASLGGRPLVDWSISACRRVSEGVVLVVPPEAGAPGPDHDSDGNSEDSSRSDRTYATVTAADAVVAGGPTRSDSVRNGLAAVPATARIVVVHDAARPLAGPELFDAVLAALDDPSVGGAVCAVAVSDTIKRVTASGEVVATVPRDDLVAVQTPQAFRAELLREAHRRAGREEVAPTDDATLVEALGATVRVVPGDPRNVKITVPADLDYAAHLVGR